eukprot:417399-Alexandrium_andersonii.AAC.1
MVPRQEAHATQHSVGFMKGELMHFYAQYQLAHPDRPLSTMDDLSMTTLGSPTRPTLKVKAAECKG